MQGSAVGATMFLGVLWFGFFAAMCVAWIILLVAAWRIMRAHESLAESAAQAVGVLMARKAP